MRSVAVAVALVMAQALAAQGPAWGAAPLSHFRLRDATAGSPAENTLLILNLLSSMGTQATLRPLTDRERETLVRAGAPFGLRVTATSALAIAAPRLTTWLNTGRPMPDLDGPVWQGKGLTAAVTGGLTYEAKWVTAALQPVFFATQNLAYTPDAPRVIGGDDFRDPVWGSGIDMPYRFGDGAYSRLDPGESYVKIRAGGVVTGFTSGSEWWGPSHYYPLLMGAEAGGYPRTFVEAPNLPVLVGRARLRYSVGRAEASGFEVLPVGERSRIVPSLVASFAPSIFPGLEVGGGRLFHVRSRPSEFVSSTALLPFKGLLKSSGSTNESETRDVNQIASVFFRLAPAGAGAEVYGEFYREDHNADLRDLIGEPDHASAFTLGVRRAWATGLTVRAFTAEVANARVSHLANVRAEGALHTHGAVAEGHTLRGQPLGSSAVPGGGGLMAAFHSIGTQRAWFAHAEVRQTVQMRDVLITGARGGVYALAVGGTQMGPRDSRTAQLGVRSGFGTERGLRVQLSLSESRFAW